MNGQTDSVRRSAWVSSLFGSISLASVAAIYALVQWTDSVAAYVCIIPCALVAMLFATAALHASWRGPCPNCRRRLAFPSPDGNRTDCDHCGIVVESRAGRVVRAEESAWARERT